MHERQRHRLILSVLQEKPIVTVRELVDLTESSEATIRRDISALHLQKKLRKMRGGAESLNPVPLVGLTGRPFSVNENVNVDRKRAIARAAVDMCEDGDAIIINGGTTTFQMVHFLSTRWMEVFTNSFPIAEHLLRYSRNTVVMPAGTIYREQNIILAPFKDDGSNHFSARRMFMGAQGISAMGVMEADPLLIHAEEKLINQADELVLMIDSSKFGRRHSKVLCPLDRVTTIITDDAITDEARKVIDKAGVELITVPERSARDAMTEGSAA